MRKVGFFMAPPLPIGAGAGKYFIEVARNFAERDVECVDVITLDQKFFNFFGRIVQIYHRFDFKSDVNAVKFETDESIQRDLGGAHWLPVGLSQLKKQLQQYDVIYTKNEVVELAILKILGYNKLPPVIIGVHTPLHYPVTKEIQSKLHNFLYTGVPYKMLIKGAARMHLSNSYTKALVDKRFKIPSTFIYYPFEVSEIQQRAANYDESTNSDLVFDASKVNIVYTGRMTEQKGIATLMDIVQLLAEKYGLGDKVNFHVFGDGSLSNIVVDAAKKYSFLKYWGYVAHEDICHILDMSDIYVTAANWETLPFNVLEAQAMGLPVVAFDIPGPNDIIEDGRTGYLVKNKEEFAEKLVVLINDKNIFKKGEIVDNVKHKFNPNKIYDQLFEMFVATSCS